jgi:glyoxylase-like metal-dependent hydrolase (beta-lactamase superfamily II)
MLEIRQFTFNPVQENTYVIFNEKGACAIIDPGCYFSTEYKELTDFVDSRKLSPKCLLNTHCHLDHVFGNRQVANTYKLKLQIHKKEEVVLKVAPVYGQQWGLPFRNYDGELIFLEEGEEVKLDDDVLKVILLPGHSPGSIGFYNEAGRFLIGGDVLFRESIGRTDLPMGDHETLLSSIRQKLFSLPDDIVVYPGHGPETSIGYEKLNNPFLVG